MEDERRRRKLVDSEKACIRPRLFVSEEMGRGAREWVSRGSFVEEEEKMEAAKFV